MEFIKLKRKHRKAEQWQALTRQRSAGDKMQYESLVVRYRRLCIAV
jgi:hypothetical protein